MQSVTHPTTATEFRFSDYKKAFIACLKTELMYRVSAKELPDIARFVLSVSKEHKLHTMFTKAGIRNVEDTVFLNPVIRDFVLSLSDRFFIEISSGFDIKKDSNSNFEHLISHISNGLCFFTEEHMEVPNKTRVLFEPNKNVLTPEPVWNNLLISKLKEILRLNNWLIVSVMIYMCLPDLPEFDINTATKS